MKKKLIVWFAVLPAFLFSQSGAPLKHVVKEGETVFAISRKYGVTPYAILKFNPGITDNIHPGDTILIPADKRHDTLVTGGRYVGFKYHTVKENETVFGIARQYRTTVDDIIKVNKLEGNTIKLGQILIIPVLYDPASSLDTTRYAFYTVQPKEGKWRVAYKHGITVEELERLNPQIKGKNLQINQRLIVPKNKAETSPAEDKNYLYYEVKPLETLYSLSKRFGVSQEDLIRLNPTLADGLKAGQIIKIPRRSHQTPSRDIKTGRYIFHKVRPKETVYGITKRYHISIARLMHHNPELTDGLKAGMVLRIPRPAFKVLFDLYSPLFFRIKRIFSPEAASVNLLEHMDTERSYRFAVLLPLRLQRYQTDECSGGLLHDKVVDYYAGIRAAVDSLRSLGVNVEYKVFDTEGNSASLEKILLHNDLTDFDFVLGPLYSGNIRKTLEALGPFNTPVVVPSFKGISSYPDLVITATDSASMADHMLSYVRGVKKNGNVVIVYDRNSQAVADTAAVRLGTLQKIKAHTSKHGSWIKPDDLKPLLKNNRSNHVVLVTKDMSLIANVLSVAEGLTSGYDLQLYNLEMLKKPEAFDLQKMAATSFHFPSRSLLIPDARIRRYAKERYGLIPTKAFLNGFDTTFDLLLRLGNADNLFDGLKKFGKTKESAYIYLYGFNPTSGFHNIASYILRINEHLEPEAVD